MMSLPVLSADAEEAFKAPVSYVDDNGQTQSVNVSFIVKDEQTKTCMLGKRNEFNLEYETALSPLNVSCANFIIPSTVNGYTVTEIGPVSFRFCNNIRGVTIPSTVTVISPRAFYQCNLKNINFSEGLKQIGGNAFYQCDLRSLNFPKSLELLAQGAFKGCYHLTSVHIPANVNQMVNPFTNCYILDTITVDAANPYFDSRDKCNGIVSTSDNKLITGCRKTVIPSTVTKIAAYAFSGQSQMESFKIPSWITSIENNAFEGCFDLTFIDIPSSVSYIGASAFYNCYRLKKVYFHGDISLQANVFEKCQSLKEVYVTASDYIFNNSKQRIIGSSESRQAVLYVLNPDLYNTGSSCMSSFSEIRQLKMINRVDIKGYKWPFDFNLVQYTTDVSQAGCHVDTIYYSIFGKLVYTEPGERYYGGDNLGIRFVVTCDEGYLFADVTRAYIGNVVEDYSIMPYDPCQERNFCWEYQVGRPGGNGSYIRSVKLTIDEPQAGGTPSFSASVESSAKARPDKGKDKFDRTGYEVDGVTWLHTRDAKGNIPSKTKMTASDVFLPGHSYGLYVHVKPAASNLFFHSDTPATINGAVAMLILDTQTETNGAVNYDGVSVVRSYTISVDSVRGDVNNDGTVNINDVVAVINHMAGIVYLQYADVNDDGTVNINDVVAIINIMAGN